MKRNLIIQVKEVFIRHYGIAVTSVKEKLVYRFDFFTGLISTLMTAGLLYYLWAAIYQNSRSIDMPFRSLITYVCLGQVVNLTRISWAQRRPAYRAAANIQTGNVALDLIRPVDYQFLQLSDALGLFIAEMVLINLPAYILSLLVFRIDLPASPEAAIGFAVSLVGAFLLAFSINYLVSIMAFWTFNTLGILYAKKALIDILAGSIIPLSLFPTWLKRVALALPFQGMAYLPLSVYIGTVEGAEIWISILQQFAWATGMLLLTRLIWLRASRRVVIQGG